MDFLQDMLTNLKFSLKPLFFFVSIVCLVTSCTTTNTESTKNKALSQKVKPPQENAVVKSSSYYLEQAKLAPATQSIPMLVSASEQFLVEDKNHQALWLANQTGVILTAQLNSELTINSQFASPSVALDNDFAKNSHQATLLYRLTIVKVASLQQLAKHNLAKEQLTILDELQQEYQLPHSAAYYQLTKVIAEQQSLQLDVIDAQLRVFALQPNPIDDDVFLFWQDLSQLSLWQINQLAANNPPNFKGWQQLLLLANKLGGQQQKFSQGLTQWQKTNQHHLANAIIPSLQQWSQLAISNVSNVAVLLPLSGNQKVAGLTAQQGILAAYQENTDRKLHFIDENTVKMTSLNDLFIEKNIDFVIGPLLKTHVEQYIEQQDLTIPTLLLNLPEATELKPHQVALSMRREDEAMQAAAALSQKNYHTPLILSSKTAISRRIANSFAKQWLSINGYTPEIIYFQPGNKMQEDLKASLEVNKSQQRVKQVKRLFNKKVKAELRNRRDIDMIYLVANPAQTKLLKPYIDVNTSPFSAIIPVFASSLSHSINDDKSDNRDLTGLVFTEIPWLLPSNQQNRALASLSNNLWPQRTDSLQRIFAMGYDSLFLASKIPSMQQANYIRHYGQTGVLKLDDNNILTRSLIWGRYRNNTVKQVNMD